MLDTTRVDLNLLVTLEALLGLRFGGGRAGVRVAACSIRSTACNAESS